MISFTHLMLTYNLAGQFSGGSKRPPEATECITSLLVCPGYGMCPRVTISQRRIPNDLSKDMKNIFDISA